MLLHCVGGGGAGGGGGGGGVVNIAIATVKAYSC